MFGGTPTMSKQAAVTSDLFRLRLAGGKVCKEVVDSERREPCWPAPRGHAKMCSSQSEWLAVTTQTTECCFSMEDMDTRP